MPNLTTIWNRSFNQFLIKISIDWTVIPIQLLFLVIFYHVLLLLPSVTRLGDLLNFGQLFKAYGHN